MPDAVSSPRGNIFKNKLKSQGLLMVTPNLYLFIENMKAKNGKIYRYLVLEEYLGNGKRRRILRINVNDAIKLLIAWKFEKPLALQGYGAGGGIRTHAGLRHRGLSPKPSRASPPDLEQNIPLYLKPSAPKLNKFMNYCLRAASEDICKQYVRQLSKPLNTNNRWSITAWKKYLRMLCEEGDEDACQINKRIKSRKSHPDLYVPSWSEVKDTITRMEDPYRAVYLVLLQSGLRVNEATYLLSNIDHLKVVNKGEFLRVELDLERGTKRSFWGYLIIKPEKMVITAAGVSDYARKQHYLRPKYIRKFVSTKMLELGIPSDVVDFIQGRTPKRVLARNYLNLVALADTYYLKYVGWLRQAITELGPQTQANYPLTSNTVRQ